MACEDDTWWQEQVEEPCLRVKRKTSRASQPLRDESPTSPSVEPPWKCQRTNVMVEEQATENTSSITPKRPVKQHNVSNGLYTANRQGVTLCIAFQDGSCTKMGRNNRCAAALTRIHQCAKCLSTNHGADSCNQVPKAPGETTGDVSGRRGQGNMSGHWLGRKAREALQGKSGRKGRK